MQLGRGGFTSSSASSRQQLQGERDSLRPTNPRFIVTSDVLCLVITLLSGEEKESGPPGLGAR